MTSTREVEPVTGACEIFLYSSDHTNVSGNTITSNCAGIGMTQDSRNPVVYDSVTHNTITYPGSVVLLSRIGAMDSMTPDDSIRPGEPELFRLQYLSLQFAGCTQVDELDLE